MTVDFDLKRAIDKELTYEIPSTIPGDPPLIIKNMATIRDDLISIPSGRQDLIPMDYEVIDKRVSDKILHLPDFKHELRPDQQEIYEEVNDSCIINAKPSWGKTFTALAIAQKLGLYTLIVVHNKNLRNQWVQEIKNCFGITPGVFGSGSYDLGGIVVGNTQTGNLTNRHQLKGVCS